VYNPAMPVDDELESPAARRDPGERLTLSAEAGGAATRALPPGRGGAGA